MWDRKEIKGRAKNVLRTSYWKAFVVSLLLVLLGEGSGIPSFDRNWGSSARSKITSSGVELDWSVLGSFLAIALFIIGIFAVIGIAFYILIASPLL